MAGKEKFLCQFSGVVYMEEENIAVLVHCDKGILCGYTTVPEGGRLSDYLNLPAKFIKLTNVSISSDTGADKSNEMFINKDNIILLVTIQDNAGRGRNIQNGYLPHIQKKPVRTRIILKDYELCGNIYCMSEKTIGQLLELDGSFLPCTDVTMHSTHNDATFATGFAAINRKQIRSLQKNDNIRKR